MAIEEKPEKLQTSQYSIYLRGNPVPIILPGVEWMVWKRNEEGNRIVELQWRFRADRMIMTLDFIDVADIVCITSTKENNGTLH